MYFIRTVVHFFIFDVHREFGVINVRMCSTCFLKFCLAKSGIFSVTLFMSRTRGHRKYNSRRIQAQDYDRNESACKTSVVIVTESCR